MIHLPRKTFVFLLVCTLAFVPAAIRADTSTQEPFAAGTPPSPAGTAPGYVTAQSISGNSIKVSWSKGGFAAGYRVYRDGAAVKDTDSTARSYIDTGLVAGQVYTYKVCTLAGGKEYWDGAGPEVRAVPFDAPAITSVSLYSDDGSYGSNIDFFIDIRYNIIENAGFYYLLSMMKEGAGGYSPIVHVIVTDGHWIQGLHKPGIATTYRFKLKAVLMDGEDALYGPTGAAAAFTYMPLNAGLSDLWKARFREYVGNLLKEPYHREWLTALLDAYSDPDAWPEGAEASAASLERLAGKLLAGDKLSREEKTMSEAIHPYGLALLMGACLSPPDREQAESLAATLINLASLPTVYMDEAQADITDYRENLRGMFETLGLAWTPSENASGVPDIRVLSPDGRTLLLDTPERVTVYSGFSEAVTATAAPLLPLRRR